MAITSEYDILEIHIRPPRPDGRRPVEMRLLGNQQDFPQGALLVDSATLAALIDPRKYGRSLGEAFFCDTVGESYGKCLAAASAQGRILRVRLRLDEQDELHDVRWERMYQRVGADWQPLTLTATTPFSRWVYNDDWRPQLSAERPLRVLAVVSSPTNITTQYHLDPIAPDERQALHAVFDAHVDSLGVTYLESGTTSPPTLSTLHRELATGGYHILHFLCHGAMHEVRTEGGGTERQGVLYLEWGPDERPRQAGEVRSVTAPLLADALKPLATPPVLVFLAACESAAHERAGVRAFRPLGQHLVRHGRVRAAVAMSEQIGVDTARDFVSTFYSRLHTHGVVDIAVNEARAAVQQQWDWGVPVLFSRLRNNQILESPLGHRSHLLDRAEQALQNAGEALETARSLANDAGVNFDRDVIGGLEALIDELTRSHEVLVRKASEFRETGSDPATFARRFEAFYQDFKKYYEGKLWTSEDTSCHRVGVIRDRVLPQLVGILDPPSLEQLRQELFVIGQADTDILAEMGGFLEAMDAAAEAVYALTLDTAPDAIARAIARKREFELQMSARIRRSRALLEKMGRGVRVAADAPLPLSTAVATASVG